MRDPLGCAICLLALACGLVALVGLVKLTIERRRARRSRVEALLASTVEPPLESPPAPSAADTPRVRVVSVPDLAGLAGPAWGAPYDDAETRPEPLKAPGRGAEAPTRPYPLPRPPKPNWNPATTLAASPEDVVRELRAAAEELETGRHELPPDLKGKR